VGGQQRGKTRPEGGKMNGGERGSEKRVAFNPGANIVELKKNWKQEISKVWVGKKKLPLVEPEWTGLITEASGREGARRYEGAGIIKKKKGGVAF